MTDPDRPIPENVRERRAAQRARIRRNRRIVTLGGLVVLIGAVAAIVAGARGGGDDDDPGAVATTQAQTAPRTTATTKTTASVAPAPATGSYRGPVPILMYHVITAPAAGTAYPELWTPRETFRSTVSLLKQEGYHGVTLGQVWKAWHGGPGLPRKPVVFSFDDGYLSQVTHAKPALRAAGWPGVLNLETKNIGPGGITKSQVRQLMRAGWEIDSHTLTHPDLTTVGDEQLRAELSDSRTTLQEDFDQPVDFVAYPAGSNDTRVRAAAKAAGYRAATTVDPGIAAKSDDPFALPRIRVNGTDSAETVLDHLRTGTGAVGAGE